MCTWSGPGGGLSGLGGCLVKGGVWSQGVSNFLGGLQFFGGSPILGVGVNSNFFLIQIFFPKISSGMHQPPSPPDTVNERPVRILLECILVKFNEFSFYRLSFFAVTSS